MRSSATVSKRERGRYLSRYVWRNRWLYLLMIPGLAYFIIFSYIPMYGVTLAFKDFSITKGILGSQWVGLKHFDKLFSNINFWPVVRNTILISLYKLLAGIPIAPGLAILLNEVRNMKFKRIVQTSVYLPYFISWVVVYGMCFSLFSIDGMVNNVIVKLGGDPVGFLTKPQYFRTMIVATSMWKESGWGSIIYLAAIAGIDPEQYEAAIIDGANRFRRIIHITIPGITKALFTVCILMLSNILNAGFDQVFNFYNEAVYSTGDIIDTYVYRLGMTSGRYELATAVGLFKSAIGFIAIIGANTASKKIIGVGLY